MGRLDMRTRTAALLRFALPALLGILLLAPAGAAQEIQGLPDVGALGRQSLRPYWHVFIAYALAVVLIFGWVVSIAKRLGALERRLQD